MNISKKFLIITGVLSVVGLTTQFLLGGFIAFIRGLVDMIMFGAILAGLFWIARFRATPWRDRWIRTSLLLGSVVGFFALCIWGVSFFSNTFPGALSKITLSNGEQTVIYYQMSHIATERYYREIASDLSTYARDGYQIYIEGVLPGTSENQVKLEQSLGMKISSGTYTDIAGIIGMSAQDETIYNGIPREQISHADLSVDDIASSLGTGTVRTTDPVDISRELSAFQLSPLSRASLGYILRGVMNLSLRYSLSSDGLFDILDPATVDALLSRRNQIVVDSYMKNRDSKSVFVYGALHFDGIFSLLKSQDPRWKVETLTPIYPYVP